MAMDAVRSRIERTCWGSDGAERCRFPKHAGSSPTQGNPATSSRPWQAGEYSTFKHAEMSKQNAYLPYFWVNGSSSNALQVSAHAATKIDVCVCVCLCHALVAIVCRTEAWNPSSARSFTCQKLRLGKQ